MLQLRGPIALLHRDGGPHGIDARDRTIPIENQDRLSAADEPQVVAEPVLSSEILAFFIAMT